MQFRKKKYKRITIRIKPQMEFKKILDTLEEIIFPELGNTQQNMKYAVLELINNSLRAHRENNISELEHLT